MVLNTPSANAEIIKQRHPCFSHAAHFKYGRIHLPVAPKCNIQCRYCLRSINRHENRPGVTEEIITPIKAVRILNKVLDQKPPMEVVAVAGPGEPLANPETFDVLQMVKEIYPHLIRCLATNGLLLHEKADDLGKLGVSTMTVTANAIDPEIGARIYDFVTCSGKKHFGKKAAEILITRQLAGVKEVVSRGMIVKINTILIPEINGGHLTKVARTYAKLGAHIMNITPLIPVGRFVHMRPPTKEEISDSQAACSVYMEQFKVCRQCRADAYGIPSRDRGRLFNWLERVEPPGRPTHCSS